MDTADMRGMDNRNARFQTTHWSLILAARTLDADRRRQVMQEILSRYWHPVYAYLRHGWRGSPQKPHDAEDLAQAFFEEIVLRRGLVGLAEQARGRFRTFLLTALNRYVAQVRRRQSARKRMPEGKLLRLEWEESARAMEPADTATPAEAFQRAWAGQLLEQVLADVEAECRQAGQLTHWEVFREQVLDPIWSDRPAAPIEQVAERLGIAHVKTAHNMIVTVKRRFRRVLEDRVRSQVAREDDIDQEIRDLIEIFSAGGADG